MQTKQAKSNDASTTTKTAENATKVDIKAGDASRVPAWANAQNGSINLQTKLAINEPGDIYEQEADRVANQVMSIPNPSTTVQHKCACGGIAGPTGECEECAKKRMALQRKSAQSASDTTAPASVSTVLSSNGTPLEASSRSFMEPRFGQDFSGVRIHTDRQAAESAQAVNALAYTVGRDVVFGVGQYRPETSEGKLLLAHELTHTIQQNQISLSASQSASFVGRKEQNALTLQRQTSTSERTQVPNRESLSKQPDSLTIRWRGSVRSSLFEFIKRLHQTEEQAAQITSTILGTSKYFTEGKEVSLETFEKALNDNKRTSFIVDADATKKLMDVVGMDLKHLQINAEIEEALGPLTDAVERMEASDLSPEKANEKAKRWQPTEPINGNWQVLKGNEELASFYMQLMEHFAGLPHSDTIKGGLTKEELDKLLGTNTLWRYYTNLFTQGYQEYQQASKGTELAPFKRLEERIFEQFTWGNPTAVRNQLRIGEGWPESGQVGIVHRSSGMLLYDSQGNPLVSFGGTQMRDPGYAGAPQQSSFAINIAEIENPALQQLLNSLRQTLGDPSRVVVRAAQVYFNTMEQVNAVVMTGLTDEIKKKFVDGLPIFIGFLLGHGLSTLLMRAPNPIMVSIGAALKGLLVAAGYILNIEFAGSAIERLLESAYHLSRIQQIEGQKLTALSEYHMEEAAKPIRSMVADIVVVVTTIGLSKLIGAIHGKDSATIECTVCDIKEGKAEEGKTESSKVKENEASGKERPFPDYVYQYVEALMERYPRLRQSKLRPIKRGTGPGMFEERMRTGSGRNSFEATLKDGRKVQLDDIGPDGSIHDTKVRSGSAEDFPEAKSNTKTRDLEIQMEKQSDFIKENGLPEGVWETDNIEFLDLLGEIKTRLSIKNISLVLRK